MTTNWNRILSGLLALIYVVVAAWTRGAEAGFKVALFAILPLACIWFADAMGGYVGPAWRGAVHAPTPGLAVCIAGWLLLLLPAIIGVAYAFTGSRS